MTAQPSVRRATTALVSSLVVHVGEEVVIAGVRLRRQGAPVLPGLARELHHLDPIALLTFGGGAAATLALTSGRGDGLTFRRASTATTGGLLANTAAHVLRGLGARTYNPGLATAAAFVLPGCAALLRALHADLVTRPR